MLLKIRRVHSSVLFLAFIIYMLLCIAAKMLLFREYALTVPGALVSCVPLQSIVALFSKTAEAFPLPLGMWIALCGLMIPFGFVMFLWVEDCNSIVSIAVISVLFSAALSGINYVLLAPVFNIDFLVADFLGALLGYGLALAVVELMFAKRIQPLIGSSR